MKSSGQQVSGIILTDLILYWNSNLHCPWKKIIIFLREPVTIYYEPATMRATSYLREATRLYKPDFLVRDKTTNQACIVEIKPSGVNCLEQLKSEKQWKRILLKKKS